MNTIHVRFQGNYSSIPDVPVPVEVVDPNLDTVAEMTMPLDATIPVSVSTPGLYLVRASMPSGERVSASVTIPSPSPDDPSPSVIATLIPRDLSPTESRAWVYSLQGVQRAVDGNPTKRTSLESLAISPQDATSALSFTPAGTYWNAEKKSDGRFRLMANDDKDQVISVTSAPDDDSRVLMRLEMKRTQLTNSEPAEWKPCYQKINFITAEQQGSLLVAIPPLPETEIVLVESSDTTGHPARPLVKGGDPKTDALLSYMRQGAFEEARAIGKSISDDDIQNILYSKRRDPSSAVIAVYYMLRAGTINHLDWVKNLADWFPFIPDGAVQYGWCLLRQNNPDHALARSYFLTATQRGIPIFSYGIRLLYDGLNLFAERNVNDSEIAMAFRAVRYLAAASDWRSAVTSLASLQAGNEINSGTEFVTYDELKR